MKRAKQYFAYSMLTVWLPLAMVSFVAGLVLWPAWTWLKAGWEAADEFYDG